MRLLFRNFVIRRCHFERLVDPVSPLLVSLVSFEDLLSRLLQGAAAMGIPQFRDGLREVHMNAPLIDEDTLHACIGLNAGTFCLKLDEGVLQ